MDKIRTKSKRPPFLMVDYRLIRSKALSANEKLVLMDLMTYGASAFPSIPRIASDTNLAERTVQYCISELVKAGCIKVTRQKKEDGGNSSNLYTVIDNGAIWSMPNKQEMQKASAESELERKIRELREAGYIVELPACDPDQPQNQPEEVKEKVPVSGSHPDTSTNSNISQENNITFISKGQRKTKTKIEKYSKDYLRDLYAYDALVIDHPDDADVYDQIINSVYRVVNTGKSCVKVNGEDVPASQVAERFLSLEQLTIEYVAKNFNACAGSIQSADAWLTTALYNADERMELELTTQLHRDNI